jgi:hypothetical protein
VTSAGPIAYEQLFYLPSRHRTSEASGGPIAGGVAHLVPGAGWGESAADLRP